MAEVTAVAGDDRARDPRIRGAALAWRLVLVLVACALMFVWRFDFESSWLFGGAVLLAIYRLPRAVRLVRRRDAVSAAPWFLLLGGTVAAFAYQSWASSAAQARFESLVSAVEQEPCRAAAILPPVRRKTSSGSGTWHDLQSGLLTYPVLVRTDTAPGLISMALHLNLDHVEVREVKVPGCAR